MHYLRWWQHGDPLTSNRRQPAQLQWLYAIAETANTDACIAWPFDLNTTGYGSVAVDGRSAGTHRVVCERAHGPAPLPNMQAAHSCGNRPCVNPRHIRWTTRAENEADKLVHGRSNRGERYGAHKLTETDVREIRRLVAAGHKHRVLAAQFGVSQPTISNVTTGVSWGWLP